MENKIRIHITLLITCLLSTVAFSQENLSAFNNFRETILLNSNRHLYLSGESIEFHARLLEQDTYRTSSLSKNIRIELLNSRGESISKQNLILKNGEISGVIILPDQSPSGWYYLRAYSNWMRNFEDSEFAVLPVKVFNTEDENASFLRQNNSGISINLFPDGKSTAIYAGYNKLQGLAVSGSILNRVLDTVCKFSTHSSGWSVIDSELKPDENYSISLNGIKSSQYSTSPDFSNSEIQLIIDDAGSSFNVKVQGIADNDLSKGSLLIHQSYTSYWEKDQVILKDARIRVPKSALPGGIYQFTLISDKNEILARRLWSGFNPDEKNISIQNFSSKLDVKQAYTFDYDTDMEESNLSVLIGMKEPNHPYTSFFPGLKGWSGTSSIPKDQRAFQGWLKGNSYPDNIVLSILDSRYDEPGTNPEFFPETRSGLISGKVFDQSSGLTISDVGVSITVLNNNYFDACQSNDNGQFYFSLPDLEGTTDYILNFTSEAGSEMQIIVNPDFEPALNETLKLFSLDDAELAFLKELNTMLQINEIYGSLTEIKERETQEETQRVTFFHPPDQTIILDEFIKLANIREIIYEVVPNVSVRKTDGRDDIRVNNNDYFLTNQTTLVLLDGIPLINQSELLNLSPDRIERIEVKNNAYVYGRNVYAAIVNFVSPNKDYAGIDLPSSSILSTIILPANESLTRIPPKEKASNIPVLENTLLWQHHITREIRNVEFNTNDTSGDFQILISGFNENGEWVFGSKEFTIGKAALK